jgi:cell wall-associated NlpC family hydrolase
VAAANSLVGKPYKWGGGHGSFNDSGYDCSGAASYVLREAGLMEGVRASGGFFSYGEKGRGDWLTVWVRNGHVFLKIGGVRFDTHGETKQDGPHWTMESRSKKRFEARKPH